MQKPPLIPVTTLLFSLTFLAAITLVPWYGFTHGFEWYEWATMAVIFMFNGTAITAGYHRLWSHRTYKAHWSLRLWFALWGAMATQNSVLHWASGHRRHHAFVDDDHKDPYSASRGFWFSHIGWMLRPYDDKRDDFSGIRDLQKDSIVMWQHRNYIPLVLATNFGIPALIGFIYGDVVASLLLSGVLRLVLSHHCTFFINSLAHIWGRRPYTDRNSARDNDVLAFFTWGEGYHNFHHIFQTDYRNGVRWWQYDPTKWMIFTASKMGLAWDLRKVSDFRIAKARVDMEYKRAGQKLTCEKALAQLEEQYVAMVAALKEWSALRQQKLEAKAEELKKQWEASEAHTRYVELKKALKEQQDRWYLALNGHLV
ncbi:fatty acid desaturase [Parendozoicomonas haliclonae]|uniref:Fatty acid desaturase n=1 Tax=Parendozoicomonas haliclonae TaxID=1960125 RepID=A0A1X7ANB7_9GAMM|nr:fatty acid desaturase [Parendozoicomonas haliclonae]SMA49565.1 Fatty acid desaturase [Parendozoicomonas haliclonae]